MLKPHNRSLAAPLVCAALASAALTPAPASAASPYLVIPDAAVAEASPAYRYANMTNEEALGELDRRGIPYVSVDPVAGVRAAIRLTGRLHGVYIHSSLPLAQRATTKFEILDARLALALDDFTAVLERHDVDEVVHYTMYRPNVPPRPPSSTKRHSPRAARGDHGVDPPQHTAPPAETTSSPAAAPQAETTSSPAARQPPETAAPPAAAPAPPSGNEAAAPDCDQSGAPASEKPAAEPAPSLDKKAAPPGEKPRERERPAGQKQKVVHPSKRDTKHTSKPATGSAGKKRSRGAQRTEATPAPSASPSSASSTNTKAAAKSAQPASKATPAPAPKRTKARSQGKKDKPRHRKTTPETKKAAPRGTKAATSKKAASKPRGLWAPPGTRHPAGLAIDVASLRKRDGTWISVARHFDGHIGERACGEGARVPDAPEARELRSIVCESSSRRIFTYVLTPDYNVAHADHFHMEIKPGVRWFLVH